jgi:hypothetical protein
VRVISRQRDRLTTCKGLLKLKVREESARVVPSFTEPEFLSAVLQHRIIAQSDAACVSSE